MQTRTLGPFEVSAIGLGCMNLSHAYGAPVSADTGERVLLAALDAGVTLFDTAALYGFGANEELVGRVLRPHRQRITLCSKGGMAGVKGEDGVTRRVPLDALLAFLGMSPKLGPIADWQLDIERKQLVVNTETYGTSEPGIFAVGDINTYPGKKKLILCGFHEATLAAYGALPFVFPGKDVFFQYTTTSPRLHAMLGVATPDKKG